MKNLRYVSIGFCAFFFLISCQREDKRFVLKNASETGLDFENRLTEAPELNILTYLYFYNGSGVAVADFNNDGQKDLYFTANMSADKLYLNQGNLKFKDITQAARIDNEDGWTTGVATVDINHDGLMDIYVCKLGKYLKIQGRNKLFVNLGNDKNGIPVFKEDAASYGLDISSFSTQAAFFDYDLDGDLDMFLLNHSVYPNRTYGNGSKRNVLDTLSGDRLMQNNDGFYTDVTKGSGIHNGTIGYGLGVVVSDVNSDGFPDIYVANDFFENDYFYINKGDGTFEDVIEKNNRFVGHTSHSSMGVDAGDINNDGLADLMTLDMLPEDAVGYQTAGRDYPYQIYEQYRKNNYAYQYMQNTLQLNRGNNRFSEIAFQSGVAATDWSWSPLFADFDNDGWKDLYITNGIQGATNDMDFISFIANDQIQKRIREGLSDKDSILTQGLPEIKLSNYFFKNQKNLSFSNESSKWTEDLPSFSNGAVYADLDNDGDLDLVVNNINEKAFLLENKTTSLDRYSNFLNIRFQSGSKNAFGIGNKVYVYQNGSIQFFENYTTRGYLSAVSPEIHIGTGNHQTIDSVRVVWGSGKYQTFKNVAANQSIIAKESEANGNFYKDFQPVKPNLLLENTGITVPYLHEDNEVMEFIRNPLVPYTTTNQGPKISVADVNTDGLEDLFIGNSKWKKATLLLQQPDGSFVPDPQSDIDASSKREDTANLFFDADGDGDPDLLVLGGGNEFLSGEPLQPKLYLNNNGKFIPDNLNFNNISINASVAKAFDFDKDGDLDLAMGSNSLPWKFGISAKNYLFENDGKGNFRDVTASKAPDLSGLGLINEMDITDMDGNGYPDLVIAGHWMPIGILLNDGKKLSVQKNNRLGQTNGFWNTVKIADFNNDGHPDFVAGNWGLNTRLKASEKEPITLYSNDFDGNGSIEPVVSYFYKGNEMAFASKDEIVSQIPSVNKKFLSYKAFAEAKFSDIFSQKKLDSATKRQVYKLESAVFINQKDGTFLLQDLPNLAQVSSVFSMLTDDLNGDGFSDIVLAGNNYELNTQLGRQDASKGLVLLNNGRGNFSAQKNSDWFIDGAVRDIQKINIGNEPYFVISKNNDSLQFIKKTINPTKK